MPLWAVDSSGDAVWLDFIFFRTHALLVFDTVKMILWRQQALAKVDGKAMNMVDMLDAVGVSDMLDAREAAKEGLGIWKRKVGFIIVI